MTKEDFKILSARDHVRQRTGMYLGSVSLEKVDRFVLGKWRTTQYVPALLKMVDEIIDNSIDEAIRTGFKHANEITVQTKKDRVVISDNGRGIPQDQVVDTETGETILRPVAAWTRVRAGTSFDDERVTIGANGVGSACVNFMSKLFVGETWQKKKLIKVTSTNGAESTQIDDSLTRAGTGTRVEFRPDFGLLGVDSLEDGDHLELISDRLTGLQIAFPEIKFKLNGRLVAATTLKKYAALYTAEDASTVVVGRDNLSYFFAASVDGHRSTTYVNGVHTRLGGAYNDFVVNAVVDEMMSMIKRKYKVEVGKSTIKSGLTFVLFARGFKNPQFDSQTKERLTNSQAQIREHYSAAGVPDANSIAKKIMACADIIEPIVEAQVAKKAAADKRAATLAQKKLRRAKVQKHVAATGKNATLFLCEGDCIHEDTLIHTIDGPKPAKEIDVDDLVFTHRHRYRKVLSTSHAIKNGIKLNGEIYSEDHRLYVYNSKEDKFEFLEVRYIDKSRHKLVKSRLIEYGIEKALHEVQTISDDGHVVTDKITMKFSESHKILYMHGTEVRSCCYRNLKPGDIIIL